MNPLDAIAIGARLTRGLGRIGADRVADAWHGSLPRSVEALAEREALERLLRRYGTPEAPLGDVAAVEVGPEEIRSSNCRNHILRVRWRDPSPDLPERFFAKMHTLTLSTRLFANSVGLWRTECDFYRNLAPRVGIPLPRVYVVAQRRSRFLLLLEDLGDRPDVDVFQNRDMAVGTTPTRIRACLATLAALHARFQQLSAPERNRLLPVARHVFQSPRHRRFVRAMNFAAIDGCRQRAPEIFTKPIAAAYRRALENWDALMAAWYREPFSLIHGDSHLGNFVRCGDEMGLIDWQLAHWAPGIHDVSYLLVQSLDEQDRIDTERELVSHYVSELAKRGIDLDPELAWQGYRGFSLYSLMAVVVSFGLGATTEADWIERAILSRAARATEQLDFAGWLDETLA